MIHVRNGWFPAVTYRLVIQMTIFNNNLKYSYKTEPKKQFLKKHQPSRNQYLN